MMRKWPILLVLLLTYAAGSGYFASQYLSRRSPLPGRPTATPRMARADDPLIAELRREGMRRSRPGSRRARRTWRQQLDELDAQRDRSIEKALSSLFSHSFYKEEASDLPWNLSFFRLPEAHPGPLLDFPLFFQPILLAGERAGGPKDTMPPRGANEPDTERVGAVVSESTGEKGLAGDEAIEPGTPYELNLDGLRWPELRVTGVMEGTPSKPGTAVINGRIVSVGEVVEGVRLEAIEENAVRVRYAQEQRVLAVE